MKDCCATSQPESRFTSSDKASDMGHRLGVFVEGNDSQRADSRRAKAHMKWSKLTL